MINRHPSTKSKIQQHIVAAFGRALLVRTAPASYELHGASASDLTAAKEWVSMFLHEAVLSNSPFDQRRETKSSRWKVSSFGKSA